jgi:integrase
LIRLLLLTARRREKVVTMRGEDISIDGRWTIPTEEREKGNAMELALPKLALDTLSAQPPAGARQLPRHPEGRRVRDRVDWNPARGRVALGN